LNGIIKMTTTEEVLQFLDFFSRDKSLGNTIPTLKEKIKDDSQIAEMIKADIVKTFGDDIFSFEKKKMIIYPVVIANQLNNPEDPEDSTKSFMHKIKTIFMTYANY